jgi:hypothetical protein
MCEWMLVPVIKQPPSEIKCIHAADLGRNKRRFGYVDILPALPRPSTSVEDGDSHARTAQHRCAGLGVSGSRVDRPYRGLHPSRSGQPLGVPSPRYSYRPGRHTRTCRLSAARPSGRHSPRLDSEVPFSHRPTISDEGCSPSVAGCRRLSDCPDMGADVPRSILQDTSAEDVCLVVSADVKLSSRRVSPPYSHLQSAVRRIVRRSLRAGHCGCLSGKLAVVTRHLVNEIVVRFSIGDRSQEHKRIGKLSTSLRVRCSIDDVRTHS